MKVILASASPRRKELLKQIGWEFTIRVSEVEEKMTKILPQEVVEELAGQKAEDVAAGILEEFRQLSEEKDPETEELLIIGADTVVACDGQILGKPCDREDTERMLQLLQGKTHEVYTGVALILLGEDDIIARRTFHEATKVTFFPMNEEEIRYYADSGEPEGKAGAYAIQGLCARYISGIEGDYNNVVGLPVGRLYQEVSRLAAKEG